MEITFEFISRVTTLPVGLPWSKDEKPIGQAAEKHLFQNNETPIEDKNNIIRASIPYPWDKVSYQITKYISCEGRYNIVYGYHFRILHELRYGMDTPVPQKLSIPYFFLESLIDSNTKVQAGNSEQLAHHGLIKILVEEALHTFTLPIAWEIFQNMTAEDDIKTLTYDINPTSSEEEEQQRGEGEATSDLAEQEEKEEETKIEEEKVEEKKQAEIEGGEKEAEKIEQGEMSPGTLEREAIATLTVLSIPIKP